VPVGQGFALLESCSRFRGFYGCSVTFSTRFFSVSKICASRCRRDFRITLSMSQKLGNLLRSLRTRYVSSIVAVIGTISAVVGQLNAWPYWPFLLAAALALGAILSFHAGLERLSTLHVDARPSVSTGNAHDLTSSQLVVSISGSSASDLSSVVHTKNLGTTVAEKFRQYQIAIMEDAPPHLTFTRGNSDEWPIEIDLAPMYEWPLRLSDIIENQGGLRGGRPSIRAIWVYYIYINFQSQLVEKDVAFTFTGSVWTPIRVDTLTQRDEFISIARNYLGYTQLSRSLARQGH
jgi:hypothetical protein